MTRAYDSLATALPQGWTSDRLKDVVALRSEKTTEASAEENYLELEDIESGTGRILNWRNTLEVGSAVTVFRKGDVLFGKLRPYLEKYYLAQSDGRCTGEILAFKAETIGSRFLFYCVASRWFIERCNALAYGTKMPRVSWSKQLAQFDVPLPPAPEQERIAEFLDVSCAAVDAAMWVKRRQLATLDALRETLVEVVLKRGLRDDAPMRGVGQDWITEIPVHWDVCRIKRVVSRVDYGISESTEPTGTFAVLKMGNIQRGEIELRDIEFVDDVTDELLLKEGDLLYNRTNSPDQVGKAAIFRGASPERVTFASYLVRLRTNHRADPYFLNYVVNSSGFLSFARRLAIPSVQQSNLNSTRYGQMLIPCPPIDEQHEIVAHLDAALRDLQRIVSTITSQMHTLAAFRTSLIDECVTGQRRIPAKALQQVKVRG